MFRFALTIFVSAFLLFQVQPMIAKFILPWFGGSSIVWTTCLMFFQILLVLGYAYSHFVHRALSPKAQWFLQSGVLLVACLFLPVRPSEYWKPSGEGDPAFHMVILLFATIGLPFFVLTTTSPLIQAWVAKTEPRRSPYRLYALSNIGSLLALVSYPFLIEPNLSLSIQSWIWSIMFGVFAVLTFWSGWKFATHNDTHATTPNDEEPLRDVVATVPVLNEDISWFRILMWMLLPMAATTMLVASNNQMTHEVAAVPFLWILPLSLYLLTFVICFDHPRWYFRPLVWILMWISVVVGSYLIIGGINVGMVVQVIGYSAISFFTAFACHGELSRLKPQASGLTLFFLMIGIGGAMGGIFVAVIAPRIFDDYLEFYIGMFLSVVLVFVAYVYPQKTKVNVPSKELEKPRSRRFAILNPVLFVFYLLGTCAVAMCLVFTGNYFLNGQFADNEFKNVLHKSRNTYGVLTVLDVDDDTDYRYLLNGRIDHGHQYIGSKWENDPVSYYNPESGLGFAMEYLRTQANERGDPLNIGVVGLGTGTIAAYGEMGDTVRYYEINPQVEWIAQNLFTYLKNCEGKVDVVIGDARIQLERDAKKMEGESPELEKFDLLAIDAFSSDAIPAHLLTRECFDLYRKCLKKNGVLAVHISNRYLDLEPVVYYAAEAVDWPCSLIDVEDPTSCTWILVSDDSLFHGDSVIHDNSESFDDDMPKIMWTDNFTSIFPLVDWKNFETGFDIKQFFPGQGDEGESDEDENEGNYE